MNESINQFARCSLPIEREETSNDDEGTVVKKQ
jgi:hypothetical protein